MKKQSTSIYSQMSTAELQILTTVVKETLDPGFYQPKNKIFTATDLWNIRRQGKSRVQRRIFS